MTGGGFGLASTVDDYMRLARMLLNQGEFDGARLLKPSTVKLMSTDQLDPRITDRGFLPGKGSVGFGFDFAVRVSQPRTAQENRGAVGEFFWDAPQPRCSGLIQPIGWQRYSSRRRCRSTEPCITTFGRRFTVRIMLVLVEIDCSDRRQHRL